MKLAIFNGSPHSDGNTFKALMAYKEFLSPDESSYFQIPHTLHGCLGCNTCVKGCRFKDNFLTQAISTFESSDAMLIGSPVHLDMPTPQTVAFLTRLNCMAEPTNREFFKGKQAFILSTAYCSGTKAVVHTIMGACEMLGFNISGRSTREYISLWKDKKVRGGMTREDVVFL